MLYSTLEIDTGLICSCLPVLAPLLHLLTGHSTASSSRDQFGARSDYGSKHSNHNSKHARQAALATEGFSVLRDDDGMNGAANVYAGERGGHVRSENEVSVEARGHELDHLGDQGQIYVTRDIDIER